MAGIPLFVAIAAMEGCGAAPPPPPSRATPIELPPAPAPPPPPAAARWVRSGGVTMIGPSVADGAREPDVWRADAALASTKDGEDLLEWFERTAVSELDLDWVDKVPLSRVYEISDEARRRAETWLQFARALENRPARVR